MIGNAEQRDGQGLGAEGRQAGTQVRLVILMGQMPSGTPMSVVPQAGWSVSFSGVVFMTQGSATGLPRACCRAAVEGRRGGRAGEGGVHSVRGVIMNNELEMETTMTSTVRPKPQRRATSIVRFESQTAIQRPISEVFERLADLPEYGRWMHRTGLFRSCSLTSEVPIGAGTTYVDSTRMGRFDGEVIEFVSPTRIAFRETLRWFGFSMTQARPEYSLEGDESATIVHHVAVGELYGWMRLMRPVAAWMANRERSSTLDSLKRSLEP